MDEGDAKLINFLMRERHGSVFEHNSFTYHVKAPIFVVREWQRHRIASYNELSGRYKKFENPDFYLPNEFRQRVEGSKPGAYQYEKWSGTDDRLKNQIRRHYDDCLDLYDYMVNAGIATEQARIVLPVALYTEFYVTMNARGLMNFLSLRNTDQAMHEIREYAKAVEVLWHAEMPITAKAFIDNGRICP